MSVLFFALLGVVASQRFNFEYAVVIETTAHNTLGSCFKFARRNATTDPIEQLTVINAKSFRTEPLAQFGDIDSLAGIKTNLQPIIDGCRAAIPKESQPYSPIFLLLGGGVRALTKQRAEVVRVVAGHVLRLSGFRYSNESVFTPSQLDEAAYGFVGANYILGIGKGASRPTLSIEALDFAVARATSGASDVEARFLDGSTQALDVSSFAQSIGDVALTAKLRALPGGMQPRQSWSCYPTGFERVVRVVRRDYRAVDYTVFGTSDALACQVELKTALDSALAGRTLESVGRAELLPVGSLEGLLTMVPPKQGVVDLANLETMAMSTCAKTMDELKVAHPTLTTTQQAALCGELYYAVVALKALNLSPQAGIAFEQRLVRGAIAVGYAVSKASTWPIGAPPRGVRCEELFVDIVDTSLPRVAIYQCDCVTFRNYHPVTVHYLTSSKLLNEVMPTFASSFLYPFGYKQTGDEFPNQYRVCSSTMTKPGKYNYTDVILQQEMFNDFVIRPQRNFVEQKK